MKLDGCGWLVESSKVLITFRKPASLNFSFPDLTIFWDNSKFMIITLLLADEMSILQSPKSTLFYDIVDRGSPIFD